MLDSSARRYLVVGVLNTALDIGIFTALSVSLGVPPVPANVTSTVIVMTVSFFINRGWVFEADDAGITQYAGFVAVTLFSGLLVQSLVILGVLGVVGAVAPGVADGLAKPFAKLCAVAVGMVTNFLGYRWVFHGGAGPPGRPGPDPVPGPDPGL